VINPFEHLQFWADATGDRSAGPFRFLEDLLHGLRVVAVTRTFLLDSSARPTIFLEWFAIGATWLAWRRGNRWLALQTGVLVAAAWGMDSISAIRGLKQQYFILTDPLIVIAAALLLANLPELRAGRRSLQLGILLASLHVSISLAEPIKHSFQIGKPLAYCVDNFPYMKRILRFPYCPIS
jgi:hypothetical protein